MTNEINLWTTQKKQKPLTTNQRKHKHHRVRLASRISYAEASKTLTGRKQRILAAIHEAGPMTDREIKEYLGYSDMNMVRPVVTNLKDDGLLIELATVRCEGTDRLVRLNAINKEVIT